MVKERSHATCDGRRRAVGEAESLESDGSEFSAGLDGGRCELSMASSIRHRTSGIICIVCATASLRWQNVLLSARMRQGLAQAPGISN